MDNEIRAFIAIELSEDARRTLGKIQNSIKKPDQRYMRWVNPSSIHLTLKFLGNVKPDAVENIASAIRKSCTGIAKFDVQVIGLGVFPNAHNPRVLWAGLKGDINTLINLQQRIDANLTPLGFVKEKRPFSPHVTLARINDTSNIQEKAALEKIITREVDTDITSIHVNAVSLMRSKLLPTGAVYTQLSHIELNDEIR